MKAAFSLRFAVRPHETRFGDKASPQAVLNYLQDAAFLHSRKDRFSVYDLFPRGLTWVLSRYRVEVDHEPSAEETITVRTWYSGRQKHHYLRDFTVTRETGEVLVRATSSWLVMDLATRRPFLHEDILEGLAPLPRRAVVDDFAPLPAFEIPEGEVLFHVRPSDVDMNRHANHVQYILWALDSVPETVREGFRPEVIEVIYRAEALAGDTILAQTGTGGEGTILHRLVRGEDGRELARLRTTWTKEG